MEAVWQHDYVSDGLLRGYIRKLRSALGDDAKNPRFIETAGGRGYRFIAPLTYSPAVPGCIESSIAPILQPPLRFVGRHEELAQLHAALERALSGERQVVFATGEPGIGKTALVDAFLAQVAGPTRIFGSDAASVASTMVRARPTFRCSRPSGGSCAGRGVR